jgi:hypothetical protein
LPVVRDGPDVEAALPAGMLEALVAAELCRPAASEALRNHYARVMPGLLAVQLRGGQGPEAKLFSAGLDLRRMTRLREGLHALFSLVADAGVACRAALGASTPEALVAERPTLAEFYAGCHFGRSMPMLYAYPGDLTADAWRGRSAQEWIDARYVGPLIHELAHLHPIDPALVPAPANLHEALAAWLGSRAWPAQIWPAGGAEDALPGGAFFASVGGWVARVLGPRGAIRAQAGLLDLSSDVEGLGSRCAAALRLYGALPFLDTGAPHLLSDAFRPERWWKLIDLHRDAALAEALWDQLCGPLLRDGHRGEPLQPKWNDHVDAIPMPGLPCFREEPQEMDRELAGIARRALLVRTERAGRRFVSAIRSTELTLDRGRCQLRSAHAGPDAIGAPPVHPFPPALCR